MPLDQALAEIPTDPAKFNEWRSQNALGMEEFIKQNKPTTFDAGTGQVTQRMSMPGLGGAATVVPGSTMQQVATPAQIEQGRRDQQRLGLEGQRVGLERERVGIARTEAERKTQGLEALPPKEIQKREAVLPQARLAVTTVGKTMGTIEETIDRLLANETGLNGITGLIYGNTPALTDAARKANADLGQLKNLAFVQGITELRAASKTGAGVGSVSDREGNRFENLKASLDRSQSLQDLKDSLVRLKSNAQFTKHSIQEAFDETYQYKQGKETAKPAAGGGNWKDL